MSTDDQVLLIDAEPELPASLHRPPAGKAVHAVVLHLHGGAFTEGMPAQGCCTVADLLADAGAVVVSLDYPVAPAHPFPQPVEAAYRALGRVAEQRKRLAGSAKLPLVIAGEEAGGNLAAAAALMARDRAGPALDGQILLSPMLDVCTATASLRRAKAGPVGCPYADGWRQYLQHACDASHPYAAPGSSLRLGGLPDTLLLTAVDDPMCDEARAFARRLREAGVRLNESVLPLATGWPASYRKACATRAAWAEAVVEQTRRFLVQLSRRTPA
jgi:acetyl esterase/lipase